MKAQQHPVYEPPDPDQHEPAGVLDVDGAGLTGAVGSVDTRYERGRKPETGGSTVWTATAWRGERVHGQFVLWTDLGAKRTRLSVGPLRSKAGVEVPASCVRARFVRYVLGDGTLIADVLDTAEKLDLAPRTARPIWLSIDVPPNLEPGAYTGELTVLADAVAPVVFALRLDVVPNVLPPPKDWAFHLDLWQNPWSVARYHRVEAWSEEHWSLLKPVLRMAADAGQKCLTTTIVERPWNAQTYDAFGSMVEWTRQADGSWSFDYTLFDAYVEFAAGCGLDGQINCYSMVPWGNRVAYVDAATGDRRVIEAEPGSDEYAELWRAFLVDFAAHLKRKGWFDRTAIAMDERPEEQMKHVIELVSKHAPGLKVALAGGDHEALYEAVHDYCIYIAHDPKPLMIAARAERHQPTTFYVCCAPARPNTFTFSPPVEAVWLGWYAAATERTGFLRWAFNSWNEDPLLDTSYGQWPAGDCFLIYPGPRSSIRFERLREGIQDFEKVRIVREALSKRDDAAARDALARLEAALGRFVYRADAPPESYAEAVSAAKSALEDASRAAAGD